MNAVSPGNSLPERRPIGGRRAALPHRPLGPRRAPLGRTVDVAVVLLGLVSPLAAQLQPSEVLVLYNSQGPKSRPQGVSDSQAIYDYYAQRRPGVLGFDLADPTLLPGNISYADYVAKIREPLRHFLHDNGLESQVSVLTLTRGLPHRILDMGVPTVGDDPSAASDRFDQHNITYASVDSELTLLWQDLEAGELDRRFDSRADQMVFNPYHHVDQSIASFDRSSITRPQAFEDIEGQNMAWRMHQGSPGGRLSDAGSIYLTSRLDGRSVQDVKRMIDRAQLPSYASGTDAIILDESPPGDLDDMRALEGSSVGHLGDDYQNTYKNLTGVYDRLILEESPKFLIGTGPGYTGTAPSIPIAGNVAVLASYGGNHDRGTGSATNDGYLTSFQGQWVDGAVMNTAESYNARAFGDLPRYADQGQLADFIAQGGTFGIGNVWEPFAFSLADNQVLLDRLLRGEMTWVEAAWSSIPWLSWQQVVLGDPLARVTLIEDPQTARWHMPATALATDSHSWDAAMNWNRQARMQVPLPGDRVVFGDTGASMVRVDVGGPRIVESLQFDGNYRLEGGQLAIRTGEIDVAQGKRVAIEGEVDNGRGLIKQGLGELAIDGRSGAIRVEQGSLAVRGDLVAITVSSQGMLDIRGAARVDEGVVLDPGARLGVGEPVGGEVRSLYSLGEIALGGTAVLDGAVLEDLAGKRGRREVLLSVASGQSVTGGIAEVDARGKLVPLLESGRPSHVAEGLFLVLHRGPRHWVLEERVALPGDTDGDADVDSLDLTQLLLGWTGEGAAGSRDWLQGDFDQDEDVDAADLTSLIIFWTGSAAGPPPRVVPEPAGWVLAALAGWMLGCPVRGRRRIAT